MKKHMTKLFAILCAMLMVIVLIPMTVTNASGNEIYVSAEGSDDSGDGSEANPYATLVKAYDESASGDTIVLLSDIAQSECVSMWHDLTIKSKDGEGPYTVTRQAGFATRSDPRSWYNPAMFEAHPDIAGITVTFTNIILDDNFLHEGNQYKNQPVAPADTSGNLSVVQDGIVGLYNDPDNIYPCVVVLDDGAILRNFGGMSAVEAEGYSELIMKSGSVIEGNLHTYSGAAGVILRSATLTMEPGSLIHNVTTWVVDAETAATVNMNGTIEDCSGETGIRLTGDKTTCLIDEDGIIRRNTEGQGAIYCFNGATLTVKGEISNNTGTGRASGIYAINNGAGGVVYIEDGAKIINNTGIGGGEGTAAGLHVGNGARVTMNGGLISGNTNTGANASGVNIYGYGTFTMNGGEIKDNSINLGVGTKSQGWAYINKGTIENGTVHDYYIQAKEQGYMSGGSYLYLSGKQIKTSPEVYFDTDAKTITPTTDNSELYLGNASAASKTALNSFVSSNFTGSTVLATWFAQTPESALHVIVSELAAQTDPVYVISYPIDASGAVSDNADPVVYAVTQDTATTGNPIDVVASAGSANGRSYAIFTAPDMFNVTFDSKGGSAVPTEAVADGQKAHEPLPPTYRYRSFEGWYTDEDYTTAYDFDTPVTQDITLYAKWALVTEDVDLSKAKIFKNVTKSENATYDPITFTFKLEPYAVKITPADLIAVSDMPAINDLTITMSGSETRAKVTLPTNVGFPIGGVYTYKVTEVDGGVADWTYDDTVYYIDLEIEEDASGKLVLNDVVVHKDTADDTKTDLEFTNIYAPQTTLEVYKTVEGDGSNPLNNQKEFTFTITFTDPGLPGNPSVATDDKTVSYGANTYGKDEALSYNVAYEFKLKHGEKIAFNMPVGTQYTVTEQGEEYYTPSAVVTEGGTAGTTQEGEYATDLTVEGTALTDNDDSTSPDNKVDFTNEYSITPPTGVRLNTEIIVIGAIILVFMSVGFVLTRRFRTQRAK